MKGMSSFQLVHDFKNTIIIGNNVIPSFWQRSSVLVLCTERSNVINTTMLTVWSSFEIEFSYIITREVITDCIKQYSETKL